MTGTREPEETLRGLSVFSRGVPEVFMKKTVREALNHCRMRCPQIPTIGKTPYADMVTCLPQTELLKGDV